MKYIILLLALFTSDDIKPSLPEVTQPAVVMNMEKLDKLVSVRALIDEFDAFEKNGIKLDGRKEMEDKLFVMASEIAGAKITNIEDLAKITGGLKPPPTKLEKFAGFVTFVNVMWVTAAILGVAAIVWLFGIYLLAIILIVPVRVWEVICYGTCIGLICLGSQIKDVDLCMVPVLPGALGLFGCLMLTQFIHFRKNDLLCEPFSWILAFAWGAIAIYYKDHVIGFLSVMALLSALGFSMGHAPGVIWMGFEKEDLIPRATSASGLILFLYILLHITGSVVDVIVPFQEGMIMMGAFVYFLGVLIMSSRYYSGYRWYSKGTENFSLYAAMNFLALISGFAAIYLGNVYGMGALTGFGGVIFYVWIMEKYYEIPWKGHGWAWSLLGLSVILYAMAVYAKANPEYFFFMPNETFPLIK